MFNFKVDNVAPAVEGITPAGGAIKGKATVTALVKDTIGVSQVEFYVGDALTPTVTDKSAPYSFSIDTSKLASGPLALKVKAYDLAGHTTAQDYTLQVDNEQPEVILAAISDDVLRATTVEVTATASDKQGAIRYVEFYVDNAKKYTAEEAGESGAFSWSWNTATVKSGSHTVTVKAYDLAGNVSTPASFRVTVDTLLPTLSITNPAANATLRGPVVVKAAATDNSRKVSKVEFYLDGELQGPALETAPYQWTWDTDATAAGPHTLTVKAYDPAGNVAVVERTVKVDQLPPESVRFVHPTAGQPVKPGYKVEIAAVDDAGIVKAEYYLNGVKAGTVTKAPFAFALPTSLMTRDYTLRVVVYDAFGGTAEASMVVSVDRTAPIVKGVSGLTVSNSGTVAVTVSILDPFARDATDIDHVEFYVNGVLAANLTEGPWLWNWDTTTTSNGYKTIKIVAYDKAGNIGSTTIGHVKVAN
jgi:hypothetical protein